MTRLEHAIRIDRPLGVVYALAAEVERYPEFLPGYLESRIIERRNGDVLLERRAYVQGKLTQWKSWAHFTPDRAIEFEHAAGPLAGMKVRWLFTALSPYETYLQIIHQFPPFRRLTLPWFREKLVYKPGINQMAHRVVQSFKKACEGNNGHG